MTGQEDLSLQKVSVFHFFFYVFIMCMLLIVCD